MEGLQYAFGHSLTVNEYQALRKASGWPELPDEEAGSGLAHSSFVCSCHLGKEIIGAVRLVWDHGYIAYFSDLMVMPAHQGKGIGKKLAKMALDWIGQKRPQGWKIKVVLISTAGNEDFYRKLGFVERPAGSMGAGMDLWLI